VKPCSQPKVYLEFIDFQPVKRPAKSLERAAPKKTGDNPIKIVARFGLKQAAGGFFGSYLRRESSQRFSDSGLSSLRKKRNF
jgi:hypothetical protein